MDCITGWLEALIRQPLTQHLLVLMVHQHQQVLYLWLPDECFQPASDSVDQLMSPDGLLGTSSHMQMSNSLLCLDESRGSLVKAYVHAAVLCPPLHLRHATQIRVTMTAACST